MQDYHDSHHQAFHSQPESFGTCLGVTNAHLTHDGGPAPPFLFMTAKKNNSKNEIVVVLHNIRSIHNVGSIFRTADGAGVSKIYLCGITPSPLDRFHNFIPQFAKVSLGAERHLPWEKAASALRVLGKLKKEGFKILAIEQAKNSVLYYKSRVVSRKSRVALVLGSEIGGLPKSILNCADEILEIPMCGAVVQQAHHPRYCGRGKESLNVSVAFGIVAYEITQNFPPKANPPRAEKLKA